MSNVLRLAIVDPNDSQRESLKAMLLGMDMIWLEAECSRYEFFADVVAQTNPDIGLVAIDADPQKALELVGRLAVASSDCAVLVTDHSAYREIDFDLLKTLMRTPFIVDGRNVFNAAKAREKGFIYKGVGKGSI